jgi:hypothetical protein
VYLKPEELQDVTISTSFFPPVYILSNGLWVKAPNQTVSTGPTVAHIFDPLSVNASHQHPSPGLIPLHSDQPQHSHKLYWRLQSASLGGILSAVMFRAVVSSSLADELEMARGLRRILKRRSRGDAVTSVVRGGGRRGSKRGGKGRQGTSELAAEEEGSTRATRSSTKRSITSIG